MEERQQNSSTGTTSGSSQAGFEGMDEEFARGLESIIGPMRQAGAGDDEIAVVTARARQFYLSRQSRTEAVPVGTEDSVPGHDEGHREAKFAESSSREAAVAPVDSAASAEDQPPYPLSFDELAEMIATGQPVPGIREIPNKLNDAPPSEAVVARTQVRKPWENRSGVDATSASLSAILQQQQATP